MELLREVKPPVVSISVMQFNHFEISIIHETPLIHTKPSVYRQSNIVQLLTKNTQTIIAHTNPCNNYCGLCTSAILVV